MSMSYGNLGADWGHHDGVGLSVRQAFRVAAERIGVIGSLPLLQVCASN